MELPPWDRLLKRIVWEQLGEITGKKILDFGSGEGITANHFAEKNSVVAVEPSEKMLHNRWEDYKYKQIIGDVSKLSEFEENSFDLIFCHNVLEYIDDKEHVINELHRLLKTGGTLSIVKHNRAGRIMQMAVLLDDMKKANDLLDGKDSVSSQFGTIRYYEDEQIVKWNNGLKLLDTFGIRTFWDLQQNQEKHGTEEWQIQMMQLEMRVSKIEEYRRIAFFHHLIFRKEQESRYGCF
ncbi:MAG: methyltransferase domain-containing protein [Lachnospiraceae bacterium]|nr:methyltransferase domain-containing protein [Lachnospiraceae bacterium]